jgi:2-polyprenyl-3-methyl-5-hydroxy-6-metoxy-1,4-benzoquinol methylase
MDLLPQNLVDKTVLDVGTGEGSWGYMLRTQKRGTPRLIGVEPFTKHVEDLKRLPIYDELHNCSGQQYLADHPKESFDIILLLEVVEHDSKEESHKLLASLEGRLNPGGLMIVSTPDGFSEGAEGYAGNEDNRHVSGWRAADFRWRGYTIFKVRKGVNWGFVVNTVAALWFIFKQGRKPVTHTIVAYRRRL